MEKLLTVTHSQTSVEEDQTAAQERRDKGEFVRGVSRFRKAVGDVDFPLHQTGITCLWRSIVLGATE